MKKHWKTFAKTKKSLEKFDELAEKSNNKGIFS